MVEPIENTYFRWLCAKVLDSDSINYRTLMLILYKTEFVWVVSADRHRIDDGIELRQDFLRETFIKRDILWLEEPCSILEILIAFAKRAQFQTDIPVRDWFWEMMTNLQLDECRQVSDSAVPVIEHILYTFIWRTYEQNGYGGLFPLRRTENDQTKIEIWYQWCEYVEERGII
jgi:hypothetical protein